MCEREIYTTRTVTPTKALTRPADKCTQYRHETNRQPYNKLGRIETPLRNVFGNYVTKVDKDLRLGHTIHERYHTVNKRNRQADRQTVSSDASAHGAADSGLDKQRYKYKRGKRRSASSIPVAAHTRATVHSDTTRRPRLQSAAGLLISRSSNLSFGS